MCTTAPRAATTAACWARERRIGLQLYADDLWLALLYMFAAILAAATDKARVYEYLGTPANTVRLQDPHLPQHWKDAWFLAGVREDVIALATIDFAVTTDDRQLAKAMTLACACERRDKPPALFLREPSKEARCIRYVNILFRNATGRDCVGTRRPSLRVQPVLRVPVARRPAVVRDHEGRVRETRKDVRGERRGLVERRHRHRRLADPADVAGTRVL
ncbi:hypothetical protein DPMN_123268 [Dreissena polymorpha]|uniref:Uncharacterized protein n=1 Tax=Dreissena polymorpha TaxID=45954 RepID=A0A9D4GU36_DREPO|nr:hypothetical protein DPMN_123268 [Dreissena polymorpha]